MQFVLALVFFMAGSGVGYAALKFWDNSRINGVNNQIANKYKLQTFQDFLNQPCARQLSSSTLSRGLDPRTPRRSL